MGRTIFLAAALGALWLLLSGFFDKGLLLFFGAASVALTAWLARRAGVVDAEGVPGGIMPGIFGYWIWLSTEIGKSNIAVARQALAVQPKLSPKLFAVPIAPRTEAGIATFANSITLTPGTVSVDLEADHILVHALTGDLADEATIAEMGARIRRCENGGAV